MHTDNSDDPKPSSFFEKITNLFHEEPQSRQDLIHIFHEYENDSLIDHATRDMLEGVMKISEKRVREIMIARAQIHTISIDDSLDSIIELITTTTHSRYPVISADKDHIEGILHAKELLRYLKLDAPDFALTSILRPAVIVPESKRVDRLLKEFREKRYHMAIVVDEFGGVSGVVTIEDILEEIVGEIEDEFDKEEQTIRQLNRHIYNIDPLTSIEDFNLTFHTNFVCDEFDTIGGLIMADLSHVPNKGEELSINDYQFKVTSAENRRILQLQVTIPETAPLPDIHD